MKAAKLVFTGKVAHSIVAACHRVRRYRREVLRVRGGKVDHIVWIKTNNVGGDVLLWVRGKVAVCVKFVQDAVWANIWETSLLAVLDRTHVLLLTVHRDAIAQLHLGYLYRTMVVNCLALCKHFVFSLRLEVWCYSASQNRRNILTGYNFLAIVMVESLPTRGVVVLRGFWCCSHLRVLFRNAPTFILIFRESDLTVHKIALNLFFWNSHFGLSRHH